MVPKSDSGMIDGVLTSVSKMFSQDCFVCPLIRWVILRILWISQTPLEIGYLILGGPYLIGEKEELHRLIGTLSAASELNQEVQDWVVYLAAQTGQSLVSAFYKHTSHFLGCEDSTSKSVWIKYIPPKVQFFGWLAWKRRIKTSVFLHRIGILNLSASTLCIFCKAHNETSEHVLLLFPLVGDCLGGTKFH